MRPNDSALSSRHFSKTPAGTLLVYGVLLGSTISSAVAQTRLKSSQVAPLSGDAKGTFATTVLRDYNSAVDHGNGISNAIAGAILDCGVLIPCTINVPANYGTGEKVPGYQLNYTNPSSPATTSGNIGIFDRRYGEARMFVNNNGSVDGLINAPSAWVYDYYATAPKNAELASYYLRQWSLDGGNNQQAAALGYYNKTTWANLLSTNISHTPGQHLNGALGTQSNSIGNMLGLSNLVTCYGGFNSEADLGCHAMDNIVAQGTVEYSGTLTGSPSPGATTLSVSATQGEYTQGAQRFLVKTNAGTISSGTISAIANNYPTVVTGSGTAWPVSTVVAQLGTNVGAPGLASVTPSSVTVGSVSALSTTSLICVADAESFEMLYPTSVTANSITANFAKVHPGNAVLSSGGLCGYLLDLTADDVTNATFPNKSQTITGTLHFAFPIIASTSATSASVWVAGGGGYQSLTSRWNPNTAAGYVLYPFAEVASVQQNGGLSDTLTVAPNNVAWTTGDSVSEFLYPAVHYAFGNAVLESYYPNITGSNAFSLTYNLPLQGYEAMMTITNNTPPSFYGSGGGNYYTPTGIHLTGTNNVGLMVDLPGDNATVAVNCVSPCNAYSTLFAVGNAAYYDFLTYDQSNKRWIMSSNVNSTHYYWAANGFGTPFSNTYMAADSNGYGYIGSQQLRSNTASNSDISGELVFSNASTMSQSLKGSYATHPECLARPQFDEGSTNRYWITYGTSSFTVNFAAAVTGTVTYSCAGRN